MIARFVRCDYPSHLRRSEIAVKWADIGFKKTPVKARDLWLHQDVDLNASYDVPSHGVVLLRVRK